jgi:hypothetical protein
LLSGKGFSHGGGGGSYTGPGDIASGAFAWWGFRAYNNAYISGVKHLVDIADASNLNPTTIDCTVTGAFDTATYNTWATAHSVSAGTALVRKLYDQVGTNHLTQGTSANMPTLNASGVVSMSVANGFGGTFLNTGNFTLSQGLSVSLITNRVTTNFSNCAVLENGVTGDALGYDAGTPLPHVASSAGIASSNAVALNTPCASQFFLNGSGSLIYVDGTSTGPSAGGPFSFSSAPLYVLGTVDVIKFTESGLWSGDQSSHFAALNTNQHTFWGF